MASAMGVRSARLRRRRPVPGRLVARIKRRAIVVTYVWPTGTADPEGGQMAAQRQRRAGRAAASAGERDPISAFGATGSRSTDRLNQPPRSTRMASSGKKKTTMAKLDRERRMRERRMDKQARKDRRKQLAAQGPDAPDAALTEAPAADDQPTLAPVGPARADA